MCELDRVGEQIPDDLLQAARIARNRPRVGVEHSHQTDTFDLGGGLHGLHRLGDHVGHHRLLYLQADFTRYNPAHIQQVLDHLRLRPRISLDGVKALLRILGIQGSGSEDLRPPEDGVERCAKFVAECRKEFILHAADIFDLFAGSALSRQKLIAALLGDFQFRDIEGNAVKASGVSVMS